LNVSLGRPISGESQKLSALRTLCWPTALPILPGEAPITADGLCANKFGPRGRLAQSMAFFRTPGTPRLYSGVAKSSASTAAIASLSARPAAG
jgi:hypothetical protein